MRSRFAVTLISLLILLSFIPNANGMYKGSDASGNPLVVATGRGCSGTLVSARIVALAAHCTYEDGLSGIFEPGGKQVIDPNSKKCGNYCGGFNVQGDFAKVISRIVPEGNYQDDRSLDVAVWVLDRDINISSNVQIATKDDVARFVNEKAIATEYGYGQTGAKDFPEWPSEGKLAFSPQGTIMEGVQMLSSKGYTQFTAIGTWTPCSGDSGGPIYVKENGIDYYLGNVVGTSIQGCFSDVTSNALVVMNMFYLHMDLIERANAIMMEQKAAEKAAAEKAAAEKAASPKKTTITCVKGKVSKKVTAFKPKCPSGYKIKK